MKLRFRIPEAGQVLGISASKVRRRIREGKLAVVYDGAQPFVTLQELERYAAVSAPPLEPYVRNSLTGKPAA